MPRKHSRFVARLALAHGIAHALLGLAMVEYNAREFRFCAGGDVFRGCDVDEGAGSRGGVDEARLGLAECELLLGRLDEAEQILSDVLPRVQHITDQSIEILAWRVAGMFASATGDAEHAALLFGVADGKLRDSGLTLSSARSNGSYSAPTVNAHAGRSWRAARFQAAYDPWPRGERRLTTRAHRALAMSRRHPSIICQCRHENLARVHSDAARGGNPRLRQRRSAARSASMPPSPPASRAGGPESRSSCGIRLIQAEGERFELSRGLHP